MDVSTSNAHWQLLTVKKGRKLNKVDKEVYKRLQ